MHYIIDLQNTLHSIPSYRTLLKANWQNAVQRLVLDLANYQDETGDHVTVVFDGASGNDLPLSSYGLEIIFSGKIKTADSVIERLTSLSKHKYEIWVITSDYALQETIYALGAHCLSPSMFIDRMSKKKGKL